jgi:cytochrome c
MSVYLRVSALCTLLLASSIPAALAQATGEQVFAKNCAVCHTVEPGKNKMGPSLAGILGRKAGSVPGFAYSPANKNSIVVWNPATFEAYLTNPRAFMPGTKMVFAGLKDPVECKAVIDFLKSH